MIYLHTKDKTYVLDGTTCVSVKDVNGKTIRHAPGTKSLVLGVVRETSDRATFPSAIPLTDLAPDAFMRRSYCLVLELRPRHTFVTDPIIMPPVDVGTGGRPSLHPNAPANRPS
jgi:hypothetical protein